MTDDPLARIMPPAARGREPSEQRVARAVEQVRHRRSARAARLGGSLAATLAIALGVAVAAPQLGGQGPSEPASIAAAPPPLPAPAGGAHPAPSPSTSPSPSPCPRTGAPSPRAAGAITPSAPGGGTATPEPSHLTRQRAATVQTPARQDAAPTRRPSAVAAIPAGPAVPPGRAVPAAPSRLPAQPTVASPACPPMQARTPPSR
jgi:hypothetical protein